MQHRPSGKSLKRRYEKELARIVGRLRSRYHPEKIFLFGSMAQGRLRPESDIDLAILKRTRKRFIERLKDVARLVDTELPTDFIVYTPEEFEQARREGRYFVTDEILHRGRLLYARKT